MKRYRKQAKIAMAVALTASSLAHTIPNVSASQEQASAQTEDSRGITINSYGDQPYTGNVAPNPTDIAIIGGQPGDNNTIVYEWFTDYDGTLVSIGDNNPPSTLGNWAVKAYLTTVTADGKVIRADSKPVSFKLVHGEGYVHINSYPNKIYDGNPVKNPTDVSIIDQDYGTYDAVSFKYYRADDTTTEIPAPSEIGNYKVKAFLEETIWWRAAESDFCDFSIVQADEHTITINSYPNHKYNGQAVPAPTDFTIPRISEYKDTLIFCEWFEDVDGALTSLGNRHPNDIPLKEMGNYAVQAHMRATTKDMGIVEVSSNIVRFSIVQGDGYVRINSYEDQVYDRNPVDDPTDISKPLETPEATFKYYLAYDTSTEIPKPSDVGDYKVKAFIPESDFYDFRVYILPLSPTTIDLEYSDREYTGSRVDPPLYAINGSNGAVTVEWFSQDDLNTPLPEAPTDVGSYVVKVSVAETDTHQGATATKEFQITKARTNISIDNFSGKVYDGAPIDNPIDITIEGPRPSYVFEYFRKAEDGSWISMGTYAPTNGGTYGVKAIIMEDENHFGSDSGEPYEFEITQATNEWITRVSITNWTYGATPSTPSATARFGDVIFTYATEENGIYSEEVPTNAGKYWIKATVEETASYTGLEEKSYFAIREAYSSIRIKSYENKKYDGNPVSDPVDIERTTNNANVTFKYYRADDTTTEITAPSEVGDYKVKAFLTGDPNYEDAESDFYDFSILAQDTVINLIYDNKVYTGQPVENPNYTVQGSNGAVTIEWFDANDLNNPLPQAPTNVGTYVVKVTVADTATHNGATATAAFDITQATNEWTTEPSISNWIYNDAPHLPIGESLFGNVTFNYASDENGTYTNTVPTNAGTYFLKAVVEDTDNYTGLEMIVRFEIAKADSSITITNDLSKEYDGTPVQDPQTTITGSTGQVTIEWYKKDTTRATTWTKLDKAPKDAGNYKVVVSVEADNNYNSATAEEEFAITLTTTNVTTPPYGGIVVNPDDSTIVVKPNDTITSNGPVVENPDGSILFPNGGAVTKPDGTVEVIQPGGILNPSPSDAEKYTPIADQNKEVEVGTPIKPEDFIINKDELPKDTEYEWKDVPNTDTVGSITATIIVKYPDGSSEEVEVTFEVVEKELQSEIVPTPEFGGIVENPDGSTIIVKPNDTITSNGPVVNQPDGSIVFPNGGTVTKPDGTIETIQPGGILNPNKPEVVPTPPYGGIVVNPDDSTIVVDKDDELTSNGPVVNQPDGSIVFPNGGTVTRPDGTIETIQPGGILNPSPSDANKYTPIVDQNKEVEIGTPVKPEDFIINKEELPKDTEFEWKDVPSTDTVGSVTATIIVKYPDGSSEEVEVNFEVVEKELQPEVVPTPPYGGIVVNPDDSTITVDKDDELTSFGPVVENPDGSILFPNGGTVTRPNGDVETIQPGGILNPNDNIVITPDDDDIVSSDVTITTEEKPQTPSTGDVTQATLWSTLVGLSTACMFFLKRKKKNQ